MASEPEPDETKQPGTVITGQEGENLLANPGFEEEGDGHKASWGIINGATINDDTAFTHSGAWSVVCTGNGNLWNNLPSTVDANAETVVSGWVYLENADDAEKVHLRYKRNKSWSPRRNCLGGKLFRCRY